MGLLERQYFASFEWQSRWNNTEVSGQITDIDSKYIMATGMFGTIYIKREDIKHVASLMKKYAEMLEDYDS